VGNKTNKPCQTSLKPGTYYWCSCGHTTTPPYCDGSHEEIDGGFTPVEFEITKDSDVALCGCGQTKTAPYCDGSHAKIE